MQAETLKREIIQSYKSVELRAEGHGSSDKAMLLSSGWIRNKVFKLAQGLEVEISQIQTQQVDHFSCNKGSLGNAVGIAGLNVSVKRLDFQQE